MKRIHYSDGKGTMLHGAGASLPGWYVYPIIPQEGAGPTADWNYEAPDGPYESFDKAREDHPDAMHGGYKVLINESQRAALVALLMENPDFVREDEPLEYWVGMLEDLPAQDPTLLNGFCL